MITKLSSSVAPKVIGPYNQGIKAGNTIYVSGQLPFTTNGDLIDEYIYNQAIQSLRNVENILKEAGADRSNIVKVTIFLKDLKNFTIVNEAYSDFFEGMVYPARTTVEVSALPKNAPLEIEAVAYVD